MSSVAVSICAIYVIVALTANGQKPLLLTLAAVVPLLLAAVVGAIWLARVRRLRAWTAAAIEKWNHLDAVKRSHRTTTEVAVLSVDALEPTGSWITMRWDRFDHVQCAWLEALDEPIWPGSLLLISPDPAQVGPGAPWPPVYYIRSTHFLASAPLGRPA
ncbi:hypothetical protein [Arthrobacter sp. UYEF21]|uniref:hypothetical protein n=1 Tax=Arthrobacter sp. UYEF21 TaxID=1756364 RepID=UPI003391A3A1